MKFDANRDFANLDFCAHPGLYQIGIGEQGVFLVEPYKGELLSHWRFATPEIARESSDKIYAMFLEYKAHGDFVGMDMARKFLQMGYTRSRRYANHKGGRKYAQDGETVLPFQNDPAKALSAIIFREKWTLAKDDPEYVRLKARHRELYDPPAHRRLPKP